MPSFKQLKMGSGKRLGMVSKLFGGICGLKGTALMVSLDYSLFLFREISMLQIRGFRMEWVGGDSFLN